MPTVLILTGNCGVGKSTIARTWAEARQGAAIHADDMHVWIRVQAIRRSMGYQEKWKADIAITATLGLVEQGLDVVIENVWLPPSLERFQDAFTDRAEVQFVRLVCGRIVNHERDETRQGTARMGPRVDTLGDELDRVSWPAFVKRVDTTELTVEQTLQVINAP